MSKNSYQNVKTTKHVTERGAWKISAILYIFLKGKDDKVTQRGGAWKISAVL
jgi:hypothetical protein